MKPSAVRTTLVRPSCPRTPSGRCILRTLLTTNLQRTRNLGIPLPHVCASESRLSLSRARKMTHLVLVPPIGAVSAQDAARCIVVRFVAEGTVQRHCNMHSELTLRKDSSHKQIGRTPTWPDLLWSRPPRPPRSNLVTDHQELLPLPR